MGYYTYHTLQTHSPQDMGVIEEAIEDLIGYCPIDDSCKWYDQDDDCKTVSKKHPTIVFAITGKGEEQGDFWQRVYYGGEKIRDESAPKWEPSPLPTRQDGGE